MVTLFLTMLFAPLVNGPIIGVVTARTPPELRAKVMTALVSVSSVSVPLGFIAAGQLLGRWEVEQVFAAIAVGLTVDALAFATVAFRRGDAEAATEAPAPAPS
jgi:predicted permease